jgi:hypothetical protein
LLLLPLLGLLGERGIWGSLDVVLQKVVLVLWNEQWPTGGAQGGEIALGAAKSEPSGDAALADLEEADDVATGHAALEGGKHTLA